MPSVAQNTKPSEIGSFQFDDDRYCLISDGEYLAGFEFYRTDHMFKGAPKLELWFTILEDDFQGRRVPKWYNCQKCQKNRKYGNFKVARRSNQTKRPRSNELFRETLFFNRNRNGN